MNQDLRLHALTGQPVAARAHIVNRTHRVIREQALEMQAKRSRTRSLWIPIAIFSALISIIFIAAWFVLDAYDLTPSGIPDASDQLIVWLIMIAPLSILLFGLVRYQRHRNGSATR